MATVSVNVDTLVTIYKKATAGPTVGFRSKYKEEPHPTTGKTIDGFKFDETRWGAEENDNFSHFVPVLWDPNTLGINEHIVPGIGDQQDLAVTSAHHSYENFQDKWRPVVNHGYYYINGKEYYLFSDDGLTSYVQSAQMVMSGGNYVQLHRNPKLGTPVLARSYRWNNEAGEYILDREIPKKIKFSGKKTTNGELITETAGQIFWENVSTAQEEFILDYGTNPVTAIFNKDVTAMVGNYHATVSGMSIADLELLDTVGVATNEDNQQFHLTYSPVDRSAPVEVYLDYQGTGIQKWDVVETLTSGVFNQVALDYDLGILKFGTPEIGGRPPYGYTIRAAYRKTVGIEYEPEKSKNSVENVSADLNPVRRFTGNGFVYLRRDSADVRRIILTAELPEISSQLYGPLFLGNSFARIKAQAFSGQGEPVEGIEIGFEILGIQIGGFGSDAKATAITNGNGVARTLYNPPRTIDGLGGITDVVSYNSTHSTLFLEGYTPVDDNSTLFLFQVAREDHVLGIPRSALNQYYEDYITAEGGAPDLTWSLESIGNYSWISGLLAPKIKWEIFHRAVHGLLTPVVYEEEDLRTGKKTVIAVLDPDAINPHTGTTPAIVPLQPSSFDTTPSGTYVHFNYILPQITPSSLTRAYMVVGPTKALLRAYSFNARLNAMVYSNTIEVLIDIPDTAKGLYHIDTVNAAPSGLLSNARYYDQESIDLEEVTITASGLIPLGWRLRSPGITLSSALDGITFLDLNPIDLFAPSQIAHEFKVN